MTTRKRLDARAWRLVRETSKHRLLLLGAKAQRLLDARARLWRRHENALPRRGRL